MIFVNDQDRADYEDLTLYASEENTMLRQFFQVLETISKLTGHGELTVTSYVRRTNKKSFHYWARALDFRIKDELTIFYLGMIMVGKAFEFFNPRFRMQPHPELFRKSGQHIHIEIRN